MRKFTVEDLKKLNPCVEGYKWYIANIKTQNSRDILLQINNHEPEWSRWLVIKMLNDLQRRKLAIFAATSVIHLYEKQCPEDKNLRQCLEVGKKYLNGEIDVDIVRQTRCDTAANACADADLDAAAEAAYKAAAYAYAAAAYNAAAYNAATHAYIYAADAAAYATNDYAYIADAADVARKEMQERIIEHAIELMNEV